MYGDFNFLLGYDAQPEKIAQVEFVGTRLALILDHYELQKGYWNIPYGIVTPNDADQRSSNQLSSF